MHEGFQKIKSKTRSLLRSLQLAPFTNMTLMYNKQYTLSRTHYHGPTDTLVVQGTLTLLPANYSPPPPPQRPGPDTYTRRTTPASGVRGGTSPWRRCSPSAAAAGALAGRCSALPNGRSGACRSRPTGGRGRSPELSLTNIA